MYKQYFEWNESIPECLYTDFKAVDKALKQSGSKNVLDVGCGNGILVKELLKRGFNAYGIDAAHDGIEIANANESEKRFFVCDVDSQKLPDEIADLKFDTIVSTQTIEHLYSPGDYIRFCASVLPVGGILIITTPYHGWLKNVLIALTNMFDYHVMALNDGGHIKFFSKRTMHALLSDNGFRVIWFEGMGRIPFVWKSMLALAVKK